MHVHVEQDVPHDIFMSHWTSAKPSTGRRTPHNALSTSTRTNHTSKVLQSTSFLKGVHMSPHVNNITNVEMALVALPVQKLLAWMPRALHVYLSGEYGGACSM